MYTAGFDFALQVMRSNAIRAAIGLMREEIYRLLLGILFDGRGPVVLNTPSAVAISLIWLLGETEYQFETRHSSGTYSWV